MSDLDKAKVVFVEESLELLQAIEQEALSLENQTEDSDSVRTIFRHIHSIKGTAGFFGLAHIEKFLHALEDMLDLLREGEINVTTKHVDVILDSVDHAKKLIKSEEDGLSDEIKEKTESLLTDIQTLSADSSETADTDKNDSEPGKWLVELQVTEEIEDQSSLNPIEQLLTIEGTEFTFVPGKIPSLSEYESSRIYGSWLIEIPKSGADKQMIETILSSSDVYTYNIDPNRLTESEDTTDTFEGAEAEAWPEEVLEDEEEDVFGDFEFEAEIVEDDDQAEVSNEAESHAAEKDAQPESEADTGGDAEETSVSELLDDGEKKSIRVRVNTLEDLMNRISELVLNRNQLLQYSRGKKDGQLSKYVNQLDKLTSQIQESAMATRMEPVGNSWIRLPRIVRDLSKELDKEINLELKGESTELDRQILEKLSEPIVHLIRNAIDHGIETAQVRKKSGKAETGHVKLQAFNSSGNIFIQIKDDGRGLDANAIKEKAIAKGILSQDEADNLSDSQIYSLLFEPGFSTKEEVSKYSGRGVGLDIVKRNIESIGGQIYIESEQGESTTFTIKIPLTLAVISALIFSSGGKKFAVSEASVFEIVWMNDENTNLLSEVNGQRLLRLRDSLIPLIQLDELLGLSGDHDIDNKFVVIIKTASATFGIVVDQVDEIQEIVVKPLSRMLHNIKAYAGCTIIGSEDIVMILDSDGISEMASIDDVVDENIIKDDAAKLIEDEEDKYLIFEENNNQKAVPLNLVARLEEFDRQDLEQVDDDYVIQYRNEVLNLIPFSKSTMQRVGDTVPALVIQSEGQQAGLVIEKFVDIVETDLSNSTISAKKGVLAVDVINGRTTEVVDLNWFYQRVSELQVARTIRQQHVGSDCVIFEHSTFLRNHLVHVFENFGFEVRIASDITELEEASENPPSLWVISAPAYMQHREEFTDGIMASDGMKLAVGVDQAPEIEKKIFDAWISDYDKDDILNAINQSEEEVS